MKKCSIVIGSLWGDEGKGHMTDILCNNPNTLNVRFNGGAQASHTVVTDDNKRHAFRHFGAGTFAGAKTYLTEDFIVNPISFSLERYKLVNDFDIVPYEIVNPNCIVTTLWDMYINQVVEIMRGEDRHGSCGLGINETVERSKNPKYKITVMDLLSKDKLIEKLLAIQNEYVESRLKNEYNLTIDNLPKKYQKLLADEENIDITLFYANEFISNIQILNDNVINAFDNVVFEGAQGLLLDQNNTEYFPHVTTSNTGIKNVMKVLERLEFNGVVDIYYMSRCYITRHGAGPLKNELGCIPYEKVIDETNIPNEFQGALRFGYLNFDLLQKEINKDLKNLIFPANINITFTCFDQIHDVFKYIESNELKSADKDDFFNLAWNILNKKIEKLNNIYGTNGLTRDSFISYKNNRDL